MYSEKRERSRCLIDLGIVCSILLESRRFFSAQRESRFCISLVWAAQVCEHGCEIQRILTRSTVESSAQRTLTVIGSPGMQANASEKVPPMPMRLITLLFPHTSLSSIITAPESTMPIYSVGLPSLRTYSPFLNAISFVSKQPRRDSIFGSSIPRKSCVLDNFIKNSVFVVLTTDFHL